MQLAVVTALLGSRDTVMPAPEQECARFFLFTNWTQREHATAEGWTVVTPHLDRGDVADRDNLLFSASWHDVMQQVAVGIAAPRLHRARDGRYRGQPLPFDPHSLGFTALNERAIARFQNLPAMLAPKFVKLQLLRIDVLSRFDFFVWADAAFEMDAMFVRRVASRFDNASVELMLLEHPFREPPTVAAEIAASLHAQVRLAALERHFTMQLSHYSDSGFGDDLGLFWLALFAVRRTPRTEALLDAWWLEVRRWQYRDQISLPFALWRSELDPSSISFVHLANESGVCELLIGATDRCCRRCAAAATHFSSWTGLGAELRALDQNQTDEERGLQRPATKRNTCVARTRSLSLALSCVSISPG